MRLVRPEHCQHPAVLRGLDGVCVACASLLARPAPPEPKHNPWATHDAEEIYQGARAERAKRRLYHFLRFGWHVLERVELEEWWHLEAMCDHVQWALEQWLKRRDDKSFESLCQNLLINAPPGVIKSRIVSVYAVAWMWLHAPDWHVIALSVNPRVAARDADYCKTLVNSEWYQTWFDLHIPDSKGKPMLDRETGEPLRWEIRQDRDATSIYMTTAGGCRESLGWGSQVVGQRADALIVDDPNDPENVYSDTVREGVNDRWKNTLVSRVNDERYSLRIGIQQRTHFLDWSSCFLEESKPVHLWLATEFDPKHRCSTPMPTGKTDEAGRPITWCDPRTVPGERLHPARMTDKVIAAEKRRGSWRWAAQHQQDPDDTSGSMFARRCWNWWRPDGAPPILKRPDGCRTPEESPALVIDLSDPKAFEWWAISVDAAFKDHDEADRVSIGVWAGKGPKRFLIANVTKRIGFNATCAEIRSLRVRYPLCYRVYIEDKANGTAIVETLTREISGVIPLEPEGGKVARGYAVQPQVEAGDVYLLDGAEWLGGETDFLGEVSRFPNGTLDDQVDMMTQLLNKMQMPHDMARTIMLASA